jgi:hypothetical protein
MAKLLGEYGRTARQADLKDASLSYMSLDQAITADFLEHTVPMISPQALKKVLLSNAKTSVCAGLGINQRNCH